MYESTLTKGRAGEGQTEMEKGRREEKEIIVHGPVHHMIMTHRVVLLIIDQALKESWPEVEHAEKQNRAFSRAEIQSLRSSSKRSKQAAEARLGGDDSLSLPKRRRTP